MAAASGFWLPRGTLLTQGHGMADFELDESGSFALFCF